MWYANIYSYIMVYRKYIGTSIKVGCTSRSLYASSGPKAEEVPTPVWPRLSDRRPWAGDSPGRGIGLLSLRCETSGPVGNESPIPVVWSVWCGWTGGRLDSRWPPCCLRVSPCIGRSYRLCWCCSPPCGPVDFFCAGNGLLSAAALPSILVSVTSQYTGRESSGAGFGAAPGSGQVILCGWSIGAHSAWRPRWGLTSFHQCLYMYGAAWVGSRLSYCR